MKRILLVIALLAGSIAMAGSAIAATAVPTAYPGKNGLIAFVRSNQVYTISSAARPVAADHIGQELRPGMESGRDRDRLRAPGLVQREHLGDEC